LIVVPPTVHTPIVNYLRECLAAEINWSRTLNVLDQRDLRLFGLTADQKEELGRRGSLELNSAEGAELAAAHAAGGAATRLVMGALFLVGRTPGNAGKPARRYCGPLLEVPLSLSRDLAAGRVTVAAEEERFTINYGLVAELLRADDEDLRRRLTDLAELVPDFPVDPGEFADFWAGFKLIAPGLPLAAGPPRRRPTRSARTTDADEESVDEAGRAVGHGEESRPAEDAASSSGPAPDQRLELIDFYLPAIAKDELFRLLPAAALVLEQAGRQSLSVLAELERLAELPLAGTAFSAVFEPADSGRTATRPASRPERPTPDGDEHEAGPLGLSRPQRAVVHSARSAPLTVVTGPPGTGKSYTITAIVLDALMRGESVLVASQMDKAVEVVARQVERIAGPLAIARSGGRQAQRELAKKISRLTGPSTRPAKPAGPAARQLAGRQRELGRRLKGLRERFRRVVALERVWTASTADYERLAAICPLPIGKVGDRAVDRATAALRRAQRALAGEPGRVRRWWGQWQRRRALALLAIARPRDATLDEIDEALTVHVHRRSIERAKRELRGPAVADALWHEIRELTKARTELALDQLRAHRESALYSLTRGVATRQQLRQLATLLRRRNPKLKRAAKQRLDQGLVLLTFRAWASTNRTLGQILPLAPAMFDLVVVDEASQCDLASAAVALARGRRAVVVGDPHQLRHVCFLSHAREVAAFERHGVPGRQREQFRYSRRSLFDAAADAVPQDCFFLLDEHFRSVPPIIDFSNRRFYEGRLRIMTARPMSGWSDAIRVVRVGGRRATESSINEAEVLAVMDEIARLAGRATASGATSIGIVSPFREQVDAILDRVTRGLDAEAIARHELVVGTAHTLQGDEKDLVILSTSIDQDSHRASLRFLENPNLFNVAVTRARRQMVVVTSVQADGLPGGLLRDYLLHAHGERRTEPATGRTSRALCDEVASALQAHGWRVFPDFHAAGMCVDLAVSDGESLLAIFCDESPSEGDDDPLEQHEILERAGWTVKRVSRRGWTDDWVRETVRLTQPVRHLT
jgi:type II secretory pathway predicted ATPase ExeA